MEKKLVNLLVKKFMINFQQSQAQQPKIVPRNKRKRNWENACCFIPSCRSEPTRELRSRKKATERKFQKINNVYADLL